MVDWLLITEFRAGTGLMPAHNQPTFTAKTASPATPRRSLCSLSCAHLHSCAKEPSASPYFSMPCALFAKTPGVPPPAPPPTLKFYFNLPPPSPAPSPSPAISMISGSILGNWGGRYCCHRRKPPRKALRLLPRRAPGGNSFSFLLLPPPRTT